MMKRFIFLAAILLCSYFCPARPLFREPSSRSDEWGFRPASGETVRVTPAPFVWREQDNAVTYEVQYARNPEFRDAVTVGGLRWNVHCPAAEMEPGAWYWRVRCTDRGGETSDWSSVRKFDIAAGASSNPMPPRRELEARIPAKHPRIFLRPEDLPRLRDGKSESLKPWRNELVRQCDALLADPPPTTEPPKYPAGVTRPSPEWIKMWWGNRLYVLKTLNAAAVLGFGYRITGDKRYGELAKKILLECAKWDPDGSTNLRYNDEAGMPYLSRFSRAYSFVNDLLDEAEREQCRKVIRIRGNAAFHSLYPRLFYRPYDSHANRLWHFLGEAGVVFYGEIPEAGDWIDAAMKFYFCVYPVWGDDDGGWHEGSDYWSGYLERFFQWADVLRNTFGIDIARKPFFNRTGYYGMYLAPPGTRDGGFADQGDYLRNQHIPTMRSLASLTANPWFQWYANQFPGARREDVYLEFLRASRPPVTPETPDRLPTSRCFRGNGLAVLNTDLTAGKQNVQIHFKSSPVGTSSHGYDANNSFLLNVFGERLLIRSGRRDMYASNFHSNWMWETKSENNITVNGIGQLKHSRDAKGKITAFSTGKRFDYVEGEAADSYEGRLKSFRRRILFCKPDAILIVDTLEAPVPSMFDWHLHAVNPFQVNGQGDVRVANNGAACRIDFLYPRNLRLTVSDRFDPPLPPHIKLVQHHLTVSPAGNTEQALFITLLRPCRAGEEPEAGAVLTENPDAFLITVPTPSGPIEFSVLRADGAVSARRNSESFHPARNTGAAGTDSPR